MTPERVIAILETIATFYSDSFASLSPQEVEEAIAYAQDKVRQDMYKQIDSKYEVSASAKIQADNFFGYDDFFTRDDLIDYIETPLYDQFSDIAFCRAFIDPDSKGRYLLSVDITNIEGYEFTIDTTVDMRKIRKSSDLQKYVSVIADKYQAELSNL